MKWTFLDTIDYLVMIVIMIFFWWYTAFDMTTWQGWVMFILIFITRQLRLFTSKQ